MTPSIVSAVQTAPNSMGHSQKDCAGCHKPIKERFLLQALDLFWHEDCLKCGCCDCRLGEVGSTLYTKANLLLCKRDYLRLFGTTGYCAACNKVIPAFEMVMRAKSNVYHLECFACQQCNHRFCVGDRFYLCDNKILCEYDYEERLVFANIASNPSSLAHMRRQVSNLQQPPSEGAGRPLMHPNGVPPSARGQANATMLLNHTTHQQVATGNAKGVSYLSEKPSVCRLPMASVSGGGCNASMQKDDGSSGYGSPDSEIVDAATHAQ